MYGLNWGLISNMIPARTGKQVRERYLNKLDPKINKDRWKQEEDEKVIKCLYKYGPRWSEISKQLEGRPENVVKNRFYSHIKKYYFELDSDYLKKLFKGDEKTLK